ncbi:hypothetical protein SLE2022_090630 [Rubroshorea leprosula]
MNPTREELKSRSVRVKNRRRAYLNKLILDGQYFSEDAMREREPYLHHEYVGGFRTQWQEYGSTRGAVVRDVDEEIRGSCAGC